VPADLLEPSELEPTEAILVGRPWRRILARQRWVAVLAVLVVVATTATAVALTRGQAPDGTAGASDDLGSTPGRRAPSVGTSGSPSGSLSPSASASARASGSPLPSASPSPSARASSPARTPVPPIVPGAPASALRHVRVSTSTQLKGALSAARPGDEIDLADRTYAGSFSSTRSGTATHPIALVGGRGAVLTNPGGHGFYVRGTYWRIIGFSVVNANIGVLIDLTHGTVVSGLSVSRIGSEGIHLRDNSTDSVVEYCTVHDTGLTYPQYGEGIYVGTAITNWHLYSGGKPDRSDRNRIVHNHVGPNVAAESVDIKEGTTGGVVADNMFDGRGMKGQNGGDSWVDVKGNGYQITGNVGTNVTSQSKLLDGYQSHQQAAGYGCGNVFRSNAVNVGGAAGYGFRMVKASGCTNTVSETNRVSGARSGASNIPLT
jgi:hypothetical protein